MNKSKFYDYEGFVEKFKPKPKLTTDDCYTPAHVYKTVLDWAKEEYGIGDDALILRPFKPGGDYQAEEYPDGCIVVDNPPFSILTSIVRWYQKRRIRFFLFAPSLALFSAIKPGNGVTAISGGQITYENGANVATGFLTNMEPGTVARTAPELSAALKRVHRAVLARGSLKLEWPKNVLTAAQLHGMRNAPFEVKVGEAVKVSSLDLADRAIYGGGFLIAEAKAKAKAKAEAEAKAKAEAEVKVYKLSERERRIVRQLKPLREV